VLDRSLSPAASPRARRRERQRVWQRRSGAGRFQLPATSQTGPALAESRPVTPNPLSASIPQYLERRDLCGGSIGQTTSHPH
jgi:hypothetical protein